MDRLVPQAAAGMAARQADSAGAGKVSMALGGTADTHFGRCPLEIRRGLLAEAADNASELEYLLGARVAVVKRDRFARDAETGLASGACASVLPKAFEGRRTDRLPVRVNRDPGDEAGFVEEGEMALRAFLDCVAETIVQHCNQVRVELSDFGFRQNIRTKRAVKLFAMRICSQLLAREKREAR
jgi:hypothetical protein